jgi:hypothetical protein
MKTYFKTLIRDDDMTGCSGAATVEICYMAMSVIAQLSGQRIARGGRLGYLEFRGRLGTGGGRRGHAVDDAAWGIRSVQPRAVDSGLMRWVFGLGSSGEVNEISTNNYWGYDNWHAISCWFEPMVEIVGFLGPNSALAHVLNSLTLFILLNSSLLVRATEKLGCYSKIVAGGCSLLICLEQKRVRGENRKERVRKVDIEWLLVLVIEALL